MAPGISTDRPALPSISSKCDQSAPVKDLYGSYHPAEPKDLRLESNFGPMVPEQMGYLQPTPVDTPIDVMRERFNNDGYLFVRFA